MVDTVLRGQLLIASVERLRTIAALQRLHAMKGFSGHLRVDLTELWKGAHVAGILADESAGDPAVLVSIYLQQAFRAEHEVHRVFTDPTERKRMLRDKGLQTVETLRAEIRKFAIYGVSRPEEGWTVPYVPWNMGQLQHGEVRNVRTGGTPDERARLLAAARTLPSSVIAEMSTAHLWLIAAALGASFGPPPLTFPERQEFAQKIQTALHESPVKVSV